MEGLVDPAPPPVHGVAPGLRGDRGLRSPLVSAVPPVSLRSWRSSSQWASPPTRSTNCMAVPCGTRIPTPVLIAVTVAGLVGAVVLGVVGLSRVGWASDPVHGARARPRRGVQLGAFRGLFHSDLGFAAAWGSFPVLVGYVAQTGRLALAPVIAAAAAFALSAAQRRLSTPARTIRRRTNRAEGQITLDNGDVVPLDVRTLLAPLETALHAMSWGIVLLAAVLGDRPAALITQPPAASARCRNSRRHREPPTSELRDLGQSQGVSAEVTPEIGPDRIERAPGIFDIGPKPCADGQRRRHAVDRCHGMHLHQPFLVFDDRTTPGFLARHEPLLWTG